MNTQQNIVQTQEKFIINLAPSVARRVSAIDRRMLIRMYLKLYNGFSFVNWSNGCTLGRAWQTAFSQCESFIKNRNSGNLAATYLSSVYASHKKYWSRVIMTYRHSVRKIDQDGQDAHKIRARGMEMIRSAMDTINLILAKYNERAKEVITEQSKSAPAPTPQQKSAPAAAAKQEMQKLPQRPAKQTMQKTPQQPAKQSVQKSTVPEKSPKMVPQPTKQEMPTKTPALGHSVSRPNVKPRANPRIKAEFNRGQQRVILYAMKLRIRVQNNIKNFAQNNTNSRAA